VRTIRLLLTATALGLLASLVFAADMDATVGAAPARQDTPAVDEAPADDTRTNTVDETPGIIPAPNSGVEPADAGKRGGAYQSVLFIVVCTGIAVVFALAVRDSRKARRRRALATVAPATEDHQPA
jgi:hypothetical protein